MIGVVDVVPEYTLGVDDSGVTLLLDRAGGVVEVAAGSPNSVREVRGLSCLVVELDQAIGELLEVQQVNCEEPSPLKDDHATRVPKPGRNLFVLKFNKPVGAVVVSE